MRGYFDDEEPERKARGRDIEVTLGAGALLGIFSGLALLCGLCFGLGYLLGHRVSATAATAAHPAAQMAAPDQEPLQASGSIPKPSADAQAPAPQPAPGSDASTGTTANGGASPGGTPASAGQPSQAAGAPAAAAPAQSQVKSAFPAAANTPQPAQGAAVPNVHPALPSAAILYMVEVAAVSHEEDADVLVGALRKRGYAVAARREPTDGLIHVRIGPFATHDQANRMWTRLLDDGYNAVVEP